MGATDSYMLRSFHDFNPSDDLLPFYYGAGHTKVYLEKIEPAALQILAETLPANVAQKIINDFKEVMIKNLDFVDSFPKVNVHRDFHIDNLFFFKTLLSLTYLFTTLVNALLNPNKCVPPSF